MSPSRRPVLPKERRSQLEVLEGLSDILATLNSSRPLAEILDHILAQACHLLQTDAGAVYRLQPEGDQFTVQASRGLSEEHVAGAALLAGLGATRQAVLRRRPVVIDDLAATIPGGDAAVDPQVRARLQSLAGRYRAVLATPLVV